MCVSGAEAYTVLQAQAAGVVKVRPDVSTSGAALPAVDEAGRRAFHYAAQRHEVIALVAVEVTTQTWTGETENLG